MRVAGIGVVCHRTAPSRAISLGHTCLLDNTFVSVYGICVYVCVFVGVWVLIDK